MLWYIKQKHERKPLDKQKQVDDKDEKLQARIHVVSDVKVALVRSLDSSAAQAVALQNVTTILARIDQRKGGA